VSPPGDIVLLSFYELGRQPLALAQAAGFLARAGLPVVAFDLAVRPLDGEVLAACAGARFIGLSVPMHTALRLALEALPRVRAAAPRAHLCAFGLYAPLHAAALRAAGVERILGGEHEEELVRAAAEGAPAASAPLVPLRRLAFPAPRRAALPPLTAYARLVAADGHEHLAGAVEATRGCKHHCRHCPIPAVYGGRFFAVPVEVVLADASAQVAAGARHLTFADADFWNAPKHALAVARAVHAAHPDVTFDATIKVEHLLAHRQLLPELAATGCVFVVSAVESLSDRVLTILDKGHRGADVVPALEAVRAAGLSLRPTFLPFTPWTRAADYLALLHFVFAHDLLGEVDPVQLSLRLLVPPGSLLLEHPELTPHLGPLDERALTYRWRHPDPAMDALCAAVQALVEAAQAEGASSVETFGRIHDLATAGAPRPPARRRATAHLSEPWFC
jgi:radical SAM superfamily enzyme YgiQ (UPF0313 family)